MTEIKITLPKVVHSPADQGEDIDTRMRYLRTAYDLIYKRGFDYVCVAISEAARLELVRMGVEMPVSVKPITRRDIEDAIGGGCWATLEDWLGNRGIHPDERAMRLLRLHWIKQMLDDLEEML